VLAYKYAIMLKKPNIYFMKYILSAFLSIILTYSFAGGSLASNATILKPEGLFAPDVNFFDSEGGKIYLDQFEGKTILLVFWATWCGTCITEMPSLDNLQKDFRKLPFEIVAVSEDFQGIDIAKKHFTENGIRHLKVFHDRQNQLFNAMSVAGLPTAFLINPEGKVKIIFKGLFKWHSEEIRDMVLAEIEGWSAKPKNTHKEISLNQKISPQKNEPEETVKEEDEDDDNEDQEKPKKSIEQQYYR